MTPLDVPRLYERYAATFRTRDCDRIAALHTSDSVFGRGPIGIR